MSKAKNGNSDSETAELLAAVLTSLPDDLPPHMRGVIDQLSLEGEALLPPRLFQEAVEQMSMAISITDTNADILFVNRAFEELTGYRSSDIIGRNEAVLSNKRTPKAVYLDLWSTIKSGNVWNGRLINRSNSGKPYLADVTIAPVKTRDGTISYFLAMHRDITEMHHLQRKVENQKNLIEGLIDVAPVVMFLVDMEGEPLIENNAYRTLKTQLGGEPAEAFLQALSGVLGDDLESACAQEIALLGADVRLEPERGGEPRWFSCSGRWVLEFEYGAEGYFETRRENALLLVCNEVTGLKRQYEQARMSQVRASMAEYELVRRTNEIIEAAQYQLQGPLNIMQALSEMMQRQQPDGHPMQAPIQEAIASGKQAAEVLRHARPVQAPKNLAPTNVNRAIRDVLVTSADSLSAAGVVVDWKPALDLPRVLATERSLHILFKNLLDNAITAVGEPGARGREVRIDTRDTDGGMVEICLDDSGCGFDKALQSRCFEPFFSAWQKRKGCSGMGLVLVQQIVGDLSGDIRFEPARSGGATACVYLPSITS